MTRWLLVAGLAVLNLVLGAGVYMRLGLERSAEAQSGIGMTKPEVAAVAGTSNGQTAVYLLDVNTGWLRTYRIDVTNHRVDPVTQINVAENLSRIR
jgi:hypothetical protein